MEMKKYLTPEMEIVELKAHQCLLTNSEPQVDDPNEFNPD